MSSLPNDQLAFPIPADRSVAKDNLFFVGIASFLCGLFAAGHTIYLAIITHTPLLVFDEWRVLARYIEFMTGRVSLLSFLWEDYQGHRPVVTRLLFILDANTVGGTQVLTETVAIIVWIFLVVLFAIVHLRQRQLPWGAQLIGVGLLFLVLFPNQQVYNFGIGWNSAIILNVFFSVLALHLLIKSIEQKVNRFALLACGLLCGVLSAFSLANGLLIWPIMLLVCARFQAWRWATIVAIVGTIIVAIYFFDFQETGALIDALKNPKEFLKFFVTFLGIPSFGVLGPQGTIFFGALGILLIVYHFFRQSWCVDRDMPTICLLLGICLFFIATAGMVSIGRFRLDIDPALVPRYYSLASPLWAAILLLGFILHKQNLEKAHKNVALITLDAGVLLVSICICGSAYFTGPSSELLKIHLHDDRELASTAILAGAPDQSVLKNIYPLSDIDVLSLVPYLASNRLSVFHSNIDYFLYQKAHNELQKPLSDGALLNGEWCAGAVDNINKIDVGRGGSTWYQISGWLLNRKVKGNADGVLFSDENGRIIGIGRMLLAGSESTNAFDGYVKTSASRSVIAYAFKADRKNLCRFGETKFTSDLATERMICRTQAATLMTCRRSRESWSLN